MFTRSNGTTGSSSPADTAGQTGLGPKPQIADRTPASPSMPSSMPAAPAVSAKDSEGAKRLSIISNDLTIMGQDLKIISKSALQVDGEIQGEIRGIDVTVGKLGKVVGTIAAETVTVDGQVMGAIQAVKVTMRTNARVEGDVHHQSLTIEEGAVFDGRSKRHDNSAELVTQIDQSRDGTPASSAPTTSNAGSQSATPPTLQS